MKPERSFSPLILESNLPAIELTRGLEEREGFPEVPVVGDGTHELVGRLLTLKDASDAVHADECIYAFPLSDCSNGKGRQ